LLTAPLALALLLRAVGQGSRELRVATEAHIEAAEVCKGSLRAVL